MDNLIDIGLNLMHKSFRKDRLEIIEEAKKVGVTQFIITGTNVHSSQIAVEYASNYPETLFSTSGVHPHDAKTCNGHTINEIEKTAQNKSVVAIGECGLDYNRNFSPQDLQRKWFEAQVELAERLDMPLFLHEREAHNDLYNILKKYDVSEKSVVHCFTGTKDEAQNYVDLGCYIGVTGWICDMKRGRDLQEAVSVIPPEKLMIETDAPFLIPKNFDKKPKRNRNEPKYLPHILETIALCMGLDKEELAIQVTKNTKEFFKNIGSEKMAVEPHKHCPICGTPIPLNELVCSPDCQKAWDARLAQAKRTRIILYAVIAIFLIIWVILNFI